MPDASTVDTTDIRLSTQVIPEHYDLVIKTDLSNDTFSGTGIVTLAIEADVPSITFNIAFPLSLKNAVLEHVGLKTETRRNAVKFEYNLARERVTIFFEGGEVQKGTVKVAMRWEGALDDSMIGYYRSPYPTKGGKPGETSYYSLTQFESTDARRAFPCLDEPGLKATYQIAMISRTGTVSLANTDVQETKHLGATGAFPRTDLLDEAFYKAVITDRVGEKEEEVAGKTGGKTEGKTEGVVVAETPAEPTRGGVFKDDWELVTFTLVPKMSTYLVAFANGEFEHIESSYTSPLTQRVVPLRAYATHDHIAQAALGLETKVRTMPIYEKVFDVPYPLPKLDTLVASAFSAGAMENWGLITGRTSVYLYDPLQSGIASKKRVIGVQSHEVSHQWFGNVVTFAWWDNLWLNESFATFCGECIIIDMIEPSWKVHSSFISEHLAQALSLDALRSSHPIEMPCPSEAVIASIFDSISYSKGGSVLRMLSNSIGQETFLRGVSIYLKAHLYGSARTVDLWAGISKASGSDVSEFMHNWVTKVGFPLITVEETAEGIKVTQNRFLSTADATPEEDQTIWHVPLELMTVADDGKYTINHDAVLKSRTTDYAIKDIANATFKLNAETCGVYRTLYSDERLAKLGNEAGRVDSAFSLNDRMGLVQDSFVLASSGYSKTSGALSLINKMGGETENLVWDEITSALGKLATTWWDQSDVDREAISKFRRTLLGPVADRLGFEYGPNDDVDTIELRTTAIAVSAACGDVATLAEYKRRFGLLMDQNDESGIPSDLRGSIFAQSVKYGGEKEYLKVLEIYRHPATPSHQIAAMQGLCATRDPALLKQTFAFVLSSEVKNQDLASFLAGLAANPLAKRDTWAFFQANYAEIMRRFKGGFGMGSLVKISFSSLSTLEDADAVEAFFAQHDRTTYEQALSQGLDSVRSKAAWLKRDVKDVHDWLAANGYIV